jgi:hypothetical protein
LATGSYGGYFTANQTINTLTLGSGAAVNAAEAFPDSFQLTLGTATGNNAGILALGGTSSITGGQIVRIQRLFTFGHQAQRPTCTSTARSPPLHRSLKTVTVF